MSFCCICHSFHVNCGYFNAIGVEVKFKNQYHPVLVDVTHVPQLTEVEYTEQGIRFGASCTLSHIAHELTAAVEREPGRFNTRVLLTTLWSLIH